MKIKVSIQIIFKIMIIVLMIIYLPSYSHQNVKVFKDNFYYRSLANECTGYI